ncbi:COG4315 family predicted lipoprotein [Hoyosella altamirensis]|uniref:Putative lipoprotein with Yx(FWY)xxD motif n=1 Tax=Hoyosella altamirensis TaxID=616997 RepID=A0A839RPB5_9ACTN|nr:hypothetical protein [Hoyosella altamirensis]MBB3037964.1 putative lipoprotein with Yx(FWY)xxD motif [Hoyosella altamirensis]
MRIRVLLAAFVLCSVSACGGEQPAVETTEPPPVEPATEGAATAAEPQQPALDSDDSPAGTSIIAAGSEFGDMLYDDSGQAIYLFDVESDGEPLCYEQCALAWPPVLTDGEPVAADGVDTELLGTVERTDGTAQVTYNGWPLYFYAAEEPWEVKCHNVFGFGGLWLVVTPEGEAAP